jgi:dynein assembly factor 1
VPLRKQVAGNSLREVGSLSALAGCGMLSSLDLTDNGLDGDAAALLALLARLPALRALYLQAGNPVASSLRPYRKSVVAALKELVYLDDRPVFDAERRAAAAWANGGEEAERAEREKLTVRCFCASFVFCAMHFFCDDGMR